MKLSRHAITVLTRQYKSVLLKCALINAGLFLAVAPAMAADTWTGAISGTNDFMDDLATNHGWDKVNGNVTGYGVSSILSIMADAATKTDAAVAAVGDSTSGLVKDVSDLQTTVGDSTSGLVKDVADLKTVSYSGTNYLDSATTLTGADTLLDTQVKANADAISGKQDKLAAVNAGNGISIDTTGANPVISVNAGNTMQFSTTTGAIDVKYDTNTFEASSSDGLKITSKGVKSGMIDDGAVGYSNIADAAVATSITGATNKLVTDNAVKTYTDGAISNAITINTNNTVTLTVGSNSANIYDTTGTDNAIKANAQNADYTVGSSNKNITTTDNTIGKALTALDGAIGDMTSFGSQNYAKTTTNVAANLTSLDSVLKNTNDIIGASINADGTKNTGAITVKTQDGTAVTDLTSAVNLIGDLSSTGITQGTLAGQIGNIGSTVADRSTGKIASTNTVAQNLLALDTAIGADATTTTNGIAATNSVNENIDALNTAIGDVSGVLVNGYTPGDLVGAVNKLDANMDAVLGAIYKSDGTYDQDAIKGTNGFDNKATSTNLTTALKSYADNVVAATGVAFGADGSVVTTYTKATSVDYDGLNANSSLKAAIEQLDGNIGAAITGVDRSASLTAATTAATSTVNANINALDAAIGNLDYTNGSVNYTNATGSVTDAIKTINANIGAATTAAKGNIVSTNTVNANLDALDAAIGDRSFATTTYVAPNDDLSTAVTKLDKELHTVNHDVRKLRHDMNRGLASVAALSALVPNARGTGNTSLSVGTGHYHGQTAMALGGAHWFTDNLMVNIGVASTMGHTRDATYRAGVSYSF